MAVSKIISRLGETRKITLNGTPNSKFEIYIKQGSNYYNFDTDNFQTAIKTLKTEIPSNGIFERNVVIPTVTSDTSYDFFVRPLEGTTINIGTTHEQKIGVLYQKGVATATFTTTEDTTLSIASGLTGGTLAVADTVLNQSGAITEASGKLVYIHSYPTWDLETGGAYTNARKVEQKVKHGRSTVWHVEDGTNIVTGLAVTGDNIIDEITVSAISGNTVTLSAAQKLRDGQKLTFSKSGWEFKDVAAKAKDSGTTSVTMSTTQQVAKVGTADVTVELDIDEYISVKPNAFPVNVDCPAGGSVAMRLQDICENYLGTRGDLDANLASKVFKVHSIPAAATSSAAERSGEAGQIGVLKNGDGDTTYADGDTLGTATTDLVYHANSEMIAGDTDIFYYKTTDGQTPTVDSSTTQGKVTVTIV
jgi:hypothetical protein